MIRRPPRSTRTATLFPYPPALPISGIKALEKLAIDHHRPDLTLLLDINPEAGLRRAQARGDENRFEQETLAFMHKVRDGFLRSEKHTSELQSLMRISYAVFCLKTKTYSITLLDIDKHNQTHT